MDPYVFDTSAVLNFGQRGQLEPLLIRFGRIYKLFTTPDVVGELTDPAYSAFYNTFIRSHFTVQSPTAAVFHLETLARIAVILGPGEIGVMALARELKGTAVLDERAARAEASTLGLKITGTLGLLNDARQRGWITDNDCLEYARRLKRKGFRIPQPGANQTFPEYLCGVE